MKSPSSFSFVTELVRTAIFSHCCILINRHFLAAKETGDIPQSRRRTYTVRQCRKLTASAVMNVMTLNKRTTTMTPSSVSKVVNSVTVWFCHRSFCPSYS